MQLFPRFAFVMVCWLLGSAQSYACSNPSRPLPQSVTRFYDSSVYGRLGVLASGDDLSGNVWIIDANKCFDFSFFRGPTLQILFNNAVGPGRETESSYIGALTVKASRRLATSAVESFFYRNRSRGGLSTWGHPRQRDQINTLDRNAVIESGGVLPLATEYDQDRAVTTDNLAALNSSLRAATSHAVAAIRDWHALVLRKSDSGYVVQRNSGIDQEKWTVPNIQGIGANQPKSFRVKNYLIKYEESSAPAGDIFFSIPKEGYDCIYIKLIAPQGKGLVLNSSSSSSDFVTLKMAGDADCVGEAIQISFLERLFGMR